MNAMQKAAWFQFLVSIGAAVGVTALYPWLGERAAGAFGLLGLLGLTPLFLRRRDNRVVVDERDRSIDQRATTLGAFVAWYFLFMTLVATVLWSVYQGENSVSLGFLNWLIWVQFAVCYGVKGLVGILGYRNQPHAA